MEPSKPSNEKGKGKRNKGKRGRKQTSKRQKKFVTFPLPNQRNICKDMVDENCAHLKINYKQWSGNEQVKSVLHKSHIKFDAPSNIPTSQEIPCMCILCPSKKYICDNWDQDRHYNGVHILAISLLLKIQPLYNVNAQMCGRTAGRKIGAPRMHTIIALFATGRATANLN